MKAWIVIDFILVTVAFGRTVRYQIVTHDNGTKEILSNLAGASPSSDLKVLAQDLNASVSKLTTSGVVLDENTVERNESTSVPETHDTTPLLNQLNSYTANGWTGQKNAVYANSTKLVIFDDEAQNRELSEHLQKKGRSENLTDSDAVSDIAESDIWDVIEELYDCFANRTDHGGTVQCLKDRVTMMFYKFLDQSIKRNFRDGEEKGYLHGKKLLKGALLPLLVFLVIKYLVALPVLAAGLITIKTFWLSLLSAGVAAFGAPWKTQNSVIKRYRPDGDGSWSHPPWVMALHASGAHDKMSAVNPATDKYFM